MYKKASNLNMHPPTEKQRAFLNDLGYIGVPPLTLREASELITSMKDGLSSSVAEKAMLLDRASPIERARIYLANVEERKRNGNQIAGWRLKVQSGAKTSQNSIYNGAFLPFEIGKQNPELLAIVGLELDNELQRRPAKGSIVVGPNQVADIKVGAKKSTVTRQSNPQMTSQPKRKGCLGILLAAVFIVVAMALQ